MAWSHLHVFVGANTNNCWEISDEDREMLFSSDSASRKIQQFQCFVKSPSISAGRAFYLHMRTFFGMWKTSTRKITYKNKQVWQVVYSYLCNSFHLHLLRWIFWTLPQKLLCSSKLVVFKVLEVLNSHRSCCWRFWKSKVNEKSK